MAIIKTYPLKNNYYGPDRLVISDMQPDSEGNVSGDTKNLTLASLKSFLGANAVLNLTTIGTSGASTYDANTNTLNVPVYDSTTYNLRALQKSSNSVPLKLNASSGTDSEVNFTEGANVTLTRNSDTEITISATGGNAGVGSITNAFGTYITGTTNTAATGAVGLGTINLNAIDGTSIATTRFLSKDNTWDIISASGSNTQFQYNNSGAFAGTPLMVITGNDEIQIGQQTNEQGKLIVSGQAAGTSGLIKIEGKSARGVTFSVQPETNVDYNVVFPDTGPGGNNKILESNSSGELAWISTPVPGPITASTGTANFLPKYSSSTALANSAIYDSSGNVGIGTTNPQTLLHVQNGRIRVNGGGANQIQLHRNPLTQSNWIQYYDTVAGSQEAVVGYTSNTNDFKVSNLASSGTVTLQSGGFTTMTLTSDQRVGIGTTSPGEKLEVNGTVNLTNLKVSGAQGTNGQALTSTGSGVSWVTPPQGTITAVSGQSGISGAGTSGPVVLTNSDRGSSQLFYKTFITDNGNNVVASANEDTITITGGAGITTSGSGDQISIANNQATNTERGGVKLFTSTVQSVNATGISSTAGRTYGIQLNSNGQAVVNVPWTSGGGGGISFSGSTVDGLTTYSNSTTAAVSSDVRLKNNFMTFDGSSEGTGVDFYSAGGTNILRFGDMTGDTASFVELWADGSRRFQIGVNGEIGLGTGASQGTSGQVLTSQGNGSPAVWSSSSGQNIANTNLTQTANRTYAMSTYALTFTGTSTISMQNSNGLVVNGNIISNSQSYAAKNSIPNKNTSFTVDFNDGNVQQVNLTNGSGNVIIGFTNIRAGARYTIITTRLGYEGTFGTYSFNSVLWPNNVTPVNVPTGSGLYNMYEFVATTTSASGMLGYAFRNYQTAS